MANGSFLRTSDGIAWAAGTYIEAAPESLSNKESYFWIGWCCYAAYAAAC